MCRRFRYFERWLPAAGRRRKSRYGTLLNEKLSTSRAGQECPAGVAEFKKDDSGATAVEFAIVAFPLFLILFAILELAYIFIIDESLVSATSTFATEIRTGQAQAAGVSATTSSGTEWNLPAAKSFICNLIFFVPNATCLSQVQIDIRPLTAFSQTTSVNPVTGSTFNTANLCFYSGNSGQVVEARAYYLYSFIDPILLKPLVTINNYVTASGATSGNYFLISAAEIFKAETYLSETNSGAAC